MGGTKLERFLPKNQHTERKLLNFKNFVNGELSKIGLHFNDKGILKLMLSKNVNNKKCAPNFQFFNEKKLKKIRITFDFGSSIFALFDTSSITQFSKFNNFLSVCWFLGRNLSNFVPLYSLYAVWQIPLSKFMHMHTKLFMTV